MSVTIVDALKSAANVSTIYGGFFVFVIGVVGNILNIIVFTSLNTFRQTSAAFYMTAASMVNIFQLVVGLLSRILITGYNIDPTKTSSFVCKARQYTLITTMLTTFTCMCLGAIDQYLSLTQRWRHFCTVKVASRLTLVAFILCFLHGVPVFFFQDLDPPLGNSQTACAFTNAGYSVYYSRFLFPILLGLLPLIIRVSFGFLAFMSARQLNQRQVPIVRLERDKQLTKMVLVEVVVGVILTLPYSVYNHLYSSSVTFSDPVSSAQNQLITSVTRIVFYGNFTIAFYIYCGVSSRFRRQLAYVLVRIHSKYWCERAHQNRLNQIVPESIDVGEIVRQSDNVK